jgi:uncharacterized membrane protein
MTADALEPAFDWGESDEGHVVGKDGGEVPARTKTENPVLLAVFGALYAVWSIAWVLAIVASPTQTASSLLDAIMFQFGEFLAIVSAPVMFGVVWWLSSRQSTGVRSVLLTLGLALLFPAPLVLPLLV